MERRGGLAWLMARLDIGGQLDKLIFFYLHIIYSNMYLLHEITRRLPAKTKKNS
ncbi:hypothetical protein YC2023_073939 [Brassica napus]